MFTDILIPALAGILAVVGDRLISYFRAKTDVKIADKKSSSDIEQSEMKAAAGIYREIVESLRADVKDMTAQLHALETDHLSCREENATLKSDLKHLNLRVAELEKKAG